MSLSKIKNNKINVLTFLVLVVLMLGVNTNTYSQRFSNPGRVTYNEYAQFIGFLNRPYKECFFFTKKNSKNWVLDYKKRNKAIIYKKRKGNEDVKVRLSFTKGICTEVVFHETRTYLGWLDDLTILEEKVKGLRNYTLYRIPGTSGYSIRGKAIDVILRDEEIMYDGISFTTYFYLLNKGKNKNLKKMKKKIGFRK